MVRSEEISRLSRYLKQKDLSYQVVIEDLQKAIDEENPSLSEQEMEELQGRKGLHQPIFHSLEIMAIPSSLSSCLILLLSLHSSLKIISIYHATATLLRSISLIQDYNSTTFRLLFYLFH